MSTSFEDPREPRPGSGAARRSSPSEALEAWRQVSGRDLPGIDQTMRAARQRRARLNPEGFVSRTLESFRRRPWLAPACGAALAALALLVPFSYQKTTGYDVSLDLSGPAAAGAGAELAGTVAQSLGAGSANVTLGASGATLTARVPVLKSAGLATKAAALAAGLTARGLPATARVTPVVETVSGNLYAMTRDRVIHIDIQAEGKSAAEIEAQVREQLAAAGFPDAQVSVTRQDGQMQLQITGHHDAGEAGEPTEFNVTVDGGAPDAKRAEIRMQPGAPMSDAEMESSLEQQLRDQGTEVDAVVKDGKVVSITPLKK